MRTAILLLALCLPTSSLALGIGDDTRDAILDCTAATPGGPEFSDAHIVIHGGTRNGTKYAGHLTTNGVDAKIDAFDGLDALTIIHIGEGYVLNYTIRISTLAYEVTASGSKFGFVRGTCTLEMAAS